MKTGALIVLGTVMVSLISAFVFISSVAKSQGCSQAQTPASASAPKT